MRILLIIFLSYIVNHCSAQLTAEQRIDSTANGKILSDFTMTDVKGDTVHFYDFKEDIIVLDVFGQPGVARVKRNIRFLIVYGIHFITTQH